MDDMAPQVLDLSTTLSYDDTVAYEAQVPTAAEAEQAAAAAASLANRIGTSKVYLLSESSRSAIGGKRKHDDHEGDLEGSKMEEDEEMEEDLSHRGNALLLTGPPIAHLPTARIFAYATHFDAHPLGLEWVDDNTCVLVFPARKDARDAFRRLQKSTAAEAPDMVMDDCMPARPFPIALWPPEERISQTLKQMLKGAASTGTGEGQGEGLKGAIRMRWARHEDVKKKGAQRESKFYKKHGASAGKELFDGRDLPPAKRRRRDADDNARETDEMRRAQLDDELDQFLAEDDDENENKSPQGIAAEELATEPEPDIPASPPSKMRSDYIAGDGRTLLERTSDLRIHNAANGAGDLASRLTAPLPRRRGQRRGGGRGDGVESTTLGDRLQPRSTEKLEWGPSERERDRDGRRGRRGADTDELDSAGVDGDRRRRRTGGGGGRERERDRDRPARPNRTAERPKKTQQELDDELDAFLRGS